jgi:hypothetical protein
MWFGVKTILIHLHESDSTLRVYEESVLLVKADNFDDAIASAERIVRKNCSVLSCEDSGFYNAFEITDDKLSNGVEVYSIMRESKIEIDKYLDKFYDTGFERTKK